MDFSTLVISSIFLVNLQLATAQNSDVPAGCEVITTSGYRYSKFWHLPTRSTGDHELRFRVKGRADAHIVLSTSPTLLNPVYEIVLGASNNNYTDLRRSSMGKSVQAVQTPNILSEKDYRGFWINLNAEKGELEIGREGETSPFFYWKDPEPLQVHYYSFSTWVNTIGKWIHKCDLPGSPAWFAARGTISNSADDLATGVRPGDEITFFNAIEKLRHVLLAQYNKEVRPSSAHTDNVTVTMGMTVHHFELDEMTGLFTLNCWIRFSWRDERLKWNASDYDGLSVLHVPAHNLWQPDVVLYNNAEANNVNHYGEVNILVYEDGSVLWVPPATLQVRCSLDLRDWPYDQQQCFLKFGSWSHDGSKIGIGLSNIQDSDISFDSYISNLRWNLTSANASAKVDYYACCAEPYPSVHFNFTVQRQSPSYRVTITAPAFIIVVLNLSMFLLPAYALQRILTGLLCLLTVCVYLLYFSLVLPAVGDHMPRVVAFYGDMVLTLGFSVLISAVLMALTSRPHSSGVPPIVRNLLGGSVGTILCLGQNISRKHDRLDMNSRAQQLVSSLDASVDNVPSATLASPDSSSQEGFHGEWLLLADAVDRIALVFLGVVYAIQAALCF